MAKQITTRELEQIMGGITGSSFVGFDSVTIPVLTGGKSNPQQGQIRKHTTLTVFCGAAPNYYRMIDNKVKKSAALDDVYNVKVQPLNVQGLWKGKGERDRGALVRHIETGERYVGVYVPENSKPVTFYTCNGVPIEKEQIVGLKESVATVKEVVATGEDANGETVETVVTVTMIPRVYKFASVTGFRLNGESYTVSDSTGQTVEVDAALVAATVQELNSREVNVNHPQNRQ